MSELIAVMGFIVALGAFMVACRAYWLAQSVAEWIADMEDITVELVGPSVDDGQAAEEAAGK